MELKERLRRSTLGLGSEDPAKYMARFVTAADCVEAADRIEALEGALRKIADEDWFYTPEPPHAPNGSNRRVPGEWAKIARSILSNKGDSDEAALKARGIE